MVLPQRSNTLLAFLKLLVSHPKLLISIFSYQLFYLIQHKYITLHLPILSLILLQQIKSFALNEQDTGMHSAKQIRHNEDRAPGLTDTYVASTTSRFIRIKSSILSLPGIWPALIPVKLLKAYKQVMKPQAVRAARVAITSREVCNFSYHHTEASTSRLVALLANQLDEMTPALVAGYCSEICDNVHLQAIYRAARAKDKLLCNLTDTELRVGRQLLYYCLVRALKPRLVFEAGTAHGIGSILMLHALILNRSEGHIGRLITVDMNPNAGKLLRQLPKTYGEFLEVRRGSSEAVLAETTESVDLFFHDTADIPVHELRHYDLLREKLSAQGVICTTWGAAGRLATYSQEQGRRYFEFTNEAAGHWSSDTLGVSLPARRHSSKGVRSSENIQFNLADKTALEQTSIA